MSAGLLKGWLDGAAERLVWIDFADYAHRVFANSNAQWLHDPNVFVGGVSQAQGVVKTQVLGIDALAPNRPHLEIDPAAPGAAVQAMLQASGAEKFVSSVFDALAHRFASTLDLVLQIPAPGSLLRAAGCDGEPSFDDLDDVGIALSNVLRKFSDKPVSGVLIAAAADIGGDEAEAMESIISAARHYGWQVVLCFEQAREIVPPNPAIDVDAVLYPEVDVASIVAAEGSMNLGGGLGGAFWQGAPAALPAGRCLLFGRIPPETQPELVVKRRGVISA